MNPTPQMDVLYMQGFGHVLGIFTRAAEPAQIETDISGFVGDGLHLRGSPPFPPPPPPPPFVLDQDLVIPPKLIAVYRTDRNWRQIFAPFTLTVTLPPNPTGPPTPTGVAAFSASAPTVTFATPSLTVAVPRVSATTPVLVLAQDTNGGSAAVISGYQILAGGTTVTIPVTGLNSGDHYDAFVFVPVLPIGVKKFVAP